MSILPYATLAPAPKTKVVARVAIFYAVILVVLAVAQLFTYDEFLRVITGFYLPGGIRFAHFITAFLVTAEVFALPFLLRMSLSPAFRWFSMILGWLVALIWITFSLWTMFQEITVNNVGFLGTAVNVTPGWWVVLISIVLAILAAWASWGLWPGKQSAKRVIRKHQ